MCISFNKTYEVQFLIPPREVYCCMVYLPCLPSFLSLSGTPLGAPLPPPDPQEFSSGDYVRVELDQDVLKLMQEGHGGWNVDMPEVSIIAMMLSSGTHRLVGIFFYKFLKHVQWMVYIVAI